MAKGEIEFRWLRISGEGALEEHASNAPILRHSKGYYVLQVRMMEGPRGEGWWGDWTDIPEIEEP